MVPLSALSSPDEGDNMIDPSEGDIVPFSGECRVTKIMGKNAMIDLTAVNGEKLNKPAGPPGMDAEEASIRAELGGGGGTGSGQNSYVS